MECLCVLELQQDFMGREDLGFTRSVGWQMGPDSYPGTSGGHGGQTMERMGVRTRRGDLE